jgi:glyceraldehyde-3-phosphate dehydrogenase (NADP+)
MKMLIGGEWVDKDRKTEVRNPFDGSVIDTVPSADASDVDRAVEIACRGLEIMRDMPRHQRGSILRKASDLIRERSEDFARTISMEVGKTIREARIEVGRTASIFQIAAEEANRIRGETLPLDAIPGAENKVGYYERVPVGVIGAITPFNLPMSLASHKLAPALAGGNSVVLKPATITPLADLKLGEVLLEAGLPPEALSIVTGEGAGVGGALISHPRIRMISFTGSREVGMGIGARAGYKKVLLELGGNAAVIVCPSANLDDVGLIARGGFSLAGQVCISVQRVLVFREIHDRFIERLAAEIGKLKVGNQLEEDTDVGPMIGLAVAKRTKEWVDEAVAAGGRLVMGGTHAGTLFQPTVIDNPPTNVRASAEEIFAPVVVVHEVDSLDQAINIANDSDYGLQAGIFTADLHEAFEAIKRLDVGGITVNEVPTYRSDLAPYGGMKESGMGREGVRFAIEEMTEPKSVIFKLA